MKGFGFYPKGVGKPLRVLSRRVWPDQLGHKKGAILYVLIYTDHDSLCVARWINELNSFWVYSFLLDMFFLKLIQVCHQYKDARIWALHLEVLSWWLPPSAFQRWKTSFGGGSCLSVKLASGQQLEKQPVQAISFFETHSSVLGPGSPVPTKFRYILLVWNI